MEKVPSVEFSRRVEILKSVFIFADVETPLLESIAQVLVPTFCDTNQLLFTQGDADFALYIVVEGSVRAHVGDYVYANFGPRQYVGEYSLVDSSVRSTSVSANEPTLLLRLDQKIFFELINTNSKLTLAMLKGLVLRLRDYNKLEVELKNSNKEVQRQKEELEKQRFELEALNSTKDKFFAIIAHDLKNPFSTVLGLSELLAREFESFDSERLKEFIHQIYKYSNNTFNLLENLLQWSMVQTGRMPLRPKLVDIGILVSENVELLQGNAKQKQIAILLDGIDRRIAFVDSNMITTVVRNLLSNAIKFTPVNGEIHITISDKGDMWLVSVTDTGIGIAPEDQKRLFKIDSNPTTIGTQQEKGTGLGLILCKEFVERNGGVIGLESVPNMGSRFYFTVPKSDYSDTLN